MIRIPPEHLMSEAFLQATFFHHCQIIGLNCALEVTSPKGRHDLLLFDHGWEHLLAIVECKLNAMAGRNQISRYALIGVPIIKLYRIQDAQPIAIGIASSKFVGVLWSDVLKMPSKQHRKKNRFSSLNLVEEVNYREA